MKIHAPLIITPRLLPGAHVGNGFISIEYSNRDGNGGRTRYRYSIDVEGRTLTADDLQSGAYGGDLQDGFSSLLSFLSAAGEAYDYARRTGRAVEDAAFPEWVAEWADAHSDELSMLAYELEDVRAIEED